MHGRVFVQRPVRPNAIIVACIGAQHAPQMPLANDNDVVQAFPANGTQSVVQQNRSAKATASRLACPECPLRASAG